MTVGLETLGIVVALLNPPDIPENFAILSDKSIEGIIPCTAEAGPETSFFNTPND